MVIAPGVGVTASDAGGVGGEVVSDGAEDGAEDVSVGDAGTEATGVAEAVTDATGGVVTPRVTLGATAECDGRGLARCEAGRGSGTAGGVAVACGRGTGGLVPRYFALPPPVLMTDGFGDG